MFPLNPFQGNFCRTNDDVGAPSATQPRQFVGPLDDTLGVDSLLFLPLGRSCRDLPKQFLRTFCVSPRYQGSTRTCYDDSETEHYDEVVVERRIDREIGIFLAENYRIPVPEKSLPLFFCVGSIDWKFPCDETIDGSQRPQRGYHVR
jgi:hypothetical protein